MVDKSIKTFLVVALAIISAFAFVLVEEDAEENDATLSLTWDVGDRVDGTISNNVSDYVDPNVPGVTFQLISPPGILGATGSPTTAGTYLGSITNATTGVVEPLSITVRQDAETFTVTFMSGYGGTVSRDSISDVPKDSSITVSNNKVTINGTTVTATANSGYHFSEWYNASGTITANRTITAYFDADPPTEYTCYLYYDANGGTGAPATQSYTGTSTSSHTFTISSTEPTRSNYTFAGWATSSSATTPSYQPGDSISVNYNSSRYLYAVWTANQYTCYLYYNANGGTGAPATQSYTGTSTSSHTFTISSTEPTRSGYTFLGWNTSASATEAAYHGGDSISVRYNSYVNLYAIWQANSYTCYLNYDANGGTGAPSNQSYTGTSTSSHTFTISSTVPTRDGYTFLGWSILSTATEPTYLPGGSIDVGYQSTVILFAIWKQILTLNIDLTYLNNHAVVMYNGAEVATTSTYQLDYGSSYTLSITNFATGYHFRYWSFYEPRGQGAYTEDSITYTGTLTTDTYVSPEFNYEVTITVNDSQMGSVDRSSLIVHNSSISTSENVLTIGSNTVTATANTGYLFGSWTIPGSVTTVTEPITITANFGDNLFSLNIDLTYSEGHAVVSFNDIVVTATSTFQLNYGSSYTLSITDFATGYQFRYWSFHEPQGQGPYTDDHQTYTGTITTNTIVWPEFNYEITIQANDPTMGSVDVSSLLAHNGSGISTSGNVLTIGSNTVTATPNTGYLFNSWTIPGSVTSITGPIAITANFEEMSGLPEVWWNNNYVNGSVDIAFDFSGKTDCYTHEMSIPLVIYDGIEDNGDGIKYFSASGYTLNISVSYNSNIVCTLTGHGQTTEGSFKSGTWVQFTLEVDAQKGTVTFNGTRSMGWNTNQQFTFTNYETVFSKEIFSFSDVVDSLAIYNIYHEDTGNGTVHPRFQVSATTTFLDTYGFVMVDPTLNVYQQFPNYNDLRLNLYSFAVYGDSITINGHTMNMRGSVIADLYYTTYKNDDGTVHYVIATESTEGAIQYEATLSNVYITWTNISSQTNTDRQCTLTFVNDKMTIEMGSFDAQDLTISMTGVWYFTTALYEPYTATETHFSMDWNSWFNMSGDAFILAIIALLVILTAAFGAIWKPSLIDYAIIVGGGVVAYILIGGL